MVGVGGRWSRCYLPSVILYDHVMCVCVCVCVGVCVCMCACMCVCVLVYMHTTVVAKMNRKDMKLITTYILW